MKIRSIVRSLSTKLVLSTMYLAQIQPEFRDAPVGGVDPEDFKNATPGSEIKGRIDAELRDAAGPTFDVETFGIDDSQGIVGDLIQNITNIIFALVGTAAVIMIIYAGFLWLTDQGNEDQVGKAKDIIRQVVVGLIVLTFAYAIISFVVSAIS